MLDPWRLVSELPEPTQQRLLASVGASVHASAEAVLASKDNRIVKERLTDALAVIGVLCDADAQQLVLDALFEAKFTPEQIGGFESELIRAAELYLSSETVAVDTARYWAANKRYWSKNQMSAFLVADCHPIDECMLARVEKHGGIFERTIADSFRSSRVLGLRCSVRPATGLDFEAGSILQIDVKRSHAPKRVEIERDGVSTKESLKFVTDITILINPASAEIAVISESGGLKFRRQLAETANQIVFERTGHIEEVRPRKTDLSSLGEKPIFLLETGDGILSAAVRSLAFRRADQRGIRTVLKADEGVDIYSAVEIQQALPLATIFQAFIELEFDAAFQNSPSRTRLAELREPSIQTFTHFSHEERLLALSLFVRMGWVDAPHAQGAALPLEELDRLYKDITILEAEAMFGASIVKLLLQSGFLKRGLPGHSAWCPHCLKTHPVRRDLALDCKYEARRVELDELETCQFDVKGTVSFLSLWLTGSSVTRRLLYDGVWHVGQFAPPGLERPAEIVFASRLRDPETLSRLSAPLLSLSDTGHGLVIAVDARGLDRALPGGWKLIGLSDCVRPDPDGLKVHTTSVVNHLLGRILAPQKASFDLSDFLEKVDSETSGNSPYQVTRKLLKTYPGRWPRGERQLVNLLHYHRPDRFPKSS